MHPAAGPKPDEAHPANPGHTRAVVQPMPSNKTGHRSAKSGSTYPTLIAGLVFLSGVLVAVIVHLTLQKSDREQLAARIKGAVDNRVSALTAATRSYEDSLHALRALYTFSNDISYAEFVGATRDTLGRYPGIGALEWAPLVAGNDRARIEAEIGRTVRSGYQFLDRAGTSGFARAAEAPEYLPLIYIEPLASNQPALGFNLLSGTSHQEIALSRTQGRIMLSRVTPLFIEESTSNGLVIYCPVYAHLPEPGILPPHENFKGLLMAVFRLDRFFTEAPDRIAAVGYDLLVIDHTPRNADGPIALHGENGVTRITDLPTAEAFNTVDSVRVPFPIWGRSWELIFRPSEAWIKAASRRQPYAVLALGIMVSGVLSLLLYGRLRYTAQIERQVSERTIELRTTQHALEQDIRHRTEAERARAQSEERYRTFMAQSADAIWRCEFGQPWPESAAVEEQVDFIFAQGVLAECNEAMARIYGCAHAAQLTGTRLRELKDPGNETNRSLIRTFIAQGFRLTETETHESDRQGKPRILLHSLVGIREEGKLMRAWGTQRDITAQRQAEREKATLERKLQEGQKLESLGVLAGGIAHDFNNLLTGILGNAGLVNQALTAGSPLHVHVREIEAASLRAAELCKQMLAYSGKGQFIIESVDLGELLKKTVPLLRLSIGKSARLHFRLAPELPLVMADATQMRQIIMNLVMNASDALGGQDGDLTLTTGVVEVGRALLQTAVLSPSVPEGSYVFIEVRDTGCGMTPETVARIFDPFFTTKFAGRGLGLAAVLGIVRRHLGALFVETSPDSGSVFRLLLPVAKNVHRPTTTKPPVSRTPWRHTGRVLLVDDEDTVRFVANRMLQSFGLEVDAAANGNEAIALFERFSHYDLVILDLTMPGMAGDEVLRRLRMIRADVCVLLMSGFTEQEVVQRFGPNEPAAFVQKPFTVEAMRFQIRQMLDPFATS